MLGLGSKLIGKVGLLNNNLKVGLFTLIIYVSSFDPLTMLMDNEFEVLRKVLVAFYFVHSLNVQEDSCSKIFFAPLPRLIIATICFNGS